MPVQLAQAARIEIEHDAGDGLRDREAAGIDPPLAAACEDRVRALCEQAILVRLRRQLPALQRHGRFGGRQLAAGEVDLLLRETVERRFGQAEVLRQQALGRVADPVGDAEGAELGEVAVVEDQDEVARLVAEAFEHVAVAAGKIPDVAGLEVVGLGEAAADRSRWCGRGPRGRTPIRPRWRASASSRIAPGSSFIETPAIPLEIGNCVTVASLPKLLPITLPSDFSSANLKVGSSLPDRSGIGNVVHEARIAGERGLRPAQCGQRGDAGGRDQKLPTLRIGHGALLAERGPAASGNVAVAGSAMTPE